jgi:cysteine desulfurase
VIYLDHNATSPLLPEARAAMVEALDAVGNPMSPHAAGRRVAMVVDRARQAVADLAGWPRDGVVLCGSATEANAHALATGRWIVGATEHPSVRAWAVNGAALPVDRCGLVQLDHLAALAREHGATGLAVQLANNETGVIQPIVEVASAARTLGLRLHVDAAQAPGRIPLDALAPADTVTLSSHKIGGPQGVGALLLRGEPPPPLLRGGPQERGLRAGTHNVAAIAGFGAACAALAAVDGDGRPTWVAMADRLGRLRDRLESGLGALGGEAVAAGAPRLPNTSAVAFVDLPDDIGAAEFVAALDLEGLCVSAGAACASGSMRRSPVLAAMGFAGDAVRYSVGLSTTEAEIEAAIAITARVLARVRG